MKVSRSGILLAVCFVVLGCIATSTTTLTSPPAMPAAAQATLPIPQDTVSPSPEPPTLQPETPTPSAAALLAPLGPSGRLVYTNTPFDVEQLDLTTGVLSTLFTPPASAYVMASSVSPDGSVIALAYQPPPSDATPNAIPVYGYTDIYLLAAPGREPTLYLKGDSDQDILLLPFWSPDGKYLYYVHYHADANEYNLERVAYPDTRPETVVKEVLFAHLSPDGSKLVYLGLDPSTYETSLHIADSTGANDVTLVDTTMFYTMDVAIFAPDGQSVVFSAVGGPQPLFRPSDRPRTPVLLTDWFGAGVALDGDLPADLWQIPVEGGSPRQLTNLGDFSIYPAFSPDGHLLVVRAVDGLYFMNADGTGQIYLSQGAGIGTLDWVP